MPALQRATFGNKGGSHQLISATLAAGSSVLDQLRFLVDRPGGHIDQFVVWSPYWGCQRVDEWWALWRGEEDPAAPRKNMVRVEVALLPIEACARFDNFSELLAAVGHPEIGDAQGGTLALAGTVAQRLATTDTPVAIPGIDRAPGLLAALWPRLWTEARLALSLRTVFASESLDTSSPPMIAVFPTELSPRWRGCPVVDRTVESGGLASRLFSGDSSPQLERLLRANVEKLPGEFSVLVRVERIVERLERLHAERGTLSDALVVVRTLEAFPEGFSLPVQDSAVVREVLLSLSNGSAGDVRTASLTRLDCIEDRGVIESALATWIEKHLPDADDPDAVWILQHHLSHEHATWWKRGVARGLAAALERRRLNWAECLWRWCVRQPTALDWLMTHLDRTAEVEGWLAGSAPEVVEGTLLEKVAQLCRTNSWSTLFATALGSSRPLVQNIEAMREAFGSPGKGVDALLNGRTKIEIVTAAATTAWAPVVARAAELTRVQPSLLGRTLGRPGFVPLLVAHLRRGGGFPADLNRPDFLATIFDDLLCKESAATEIATHLSASAGAFALDHPSADSLLGCLGPKVVSGAAEEWWTRFLADERVPPPPLPIRAQIINSGGDRTKGASITLVIRLLELVPDVTEGSFVEWMRHTGFFWVTGDHERVASLLVSRNWREAARTFRRSWKRELKLVAWHARSLLAWSDRFWWPPTGVEETTTAPSSKLQASATGTQMKISFLASNPLTSDRLSLDEEARLIEQKVRGAKHRDLVSFRTRWAVRPQDLQQALLEDEPVVVHFSGHGSGASGIVLHSKGQDEEELATGDSLADLFRVLKDDIRLVLLNACYSEVQAKAIVQEIDFVVGMSDSVGDEAARVFAAAFYRGLAFGKSVQTAFDLGLSELRLVGLGHEDHIPQLLVRSGIDASTTILLGSSSS